MKKHVELVITELKSINTYSVKVIKAALIFFNVLVIAGGAFMLFPELLSDSVASAFAASEFLSTAPRLLTLGVCIALIFDLWMRVKQKNEN